MGCFESQTRQTLQHAIYVTIIREWIPNYSTVIFFAITYCNWMIWYKWQVLLLFNHHLNLRWMRCWFTLFFGLHQSRTVFSISIYFWFGGDVYLLLRWISYDFVCSCWFLCFIIVLRSREVWRYDVVLSVIRSNLLNLWYWNITIIYSRWYNIIIICNNIIITM